MGEFDKDTVLIVDDNPKNIDVLIGMIEPVGCHIAVATSGESTLEIINNVVPDLLLLDVEMPGMDGYQTCEYIKNHDDFKEIPVIFVTAKSEICDLKTGFDVGCVDYIRKPIQQEEVVARVRTHLRLRKLSKTLQQHNRQLSSILATVMEGTFCADLNGKISSINPAALKELGYTDTEIMGEPLGRLIPDFGTSKADWKKSIAYAVSLKGKGEYFSENHVFKRKDGSTFPAEFTVAPLIDGGSEDLGVIFAFRDISERKESLQQLVSLMSTDQLTGLVNWSEFRRQLSEVLSRSDQSKQEIVLFLLDIDDFRDVNDTLGHDIGDQLLTMVADRLRSHFPEEVMITRLGGDEFALLQVYDGNTLNLEQEATDILDVMHHSYRVLQHKLYVSVSLGVVVKGDLQFSADDMIRAADVAVYRAKESGRNSFQVFSSEMQKQVINRINTVNSIRKGLEENQFVPYFQPLIDVKTGAVIGAEGLARWIKDGKVIAPGQFITEAEDSGLIGELGQSIYDAAFSAASRWCDDGHDAYIAVNVSVKQLQSRDFGQTISELLVRNNLQAKNLVLEVTETSLMHDIEHVMPIFEALRKQGARIAIDDFGTGFSSLSYLTRIHADILKIDRSFVMDIGVDAAQETIVKTIISMAHNLGMTVVAEGVETQEQVDYLQAHHCDTFQGYYFGKPVPDADFLNILKQQSS